MLDFIGDIHGHADKLEALLQKMGYEKQNGTYKHHERKALFLGDYIDRGPKIRETLEIVKAMVDEGHATALMGNHEYNALCFHFEGKKGGHLRKHLIKNIVQHYETLQQFHGSQREYEYYLDWFKTLPLYIETVEFKAVHACWDSKHIGLLKNTLNEGRLTDDLIYQSVEERGSDLYNAVDQTLKGKELTMPNGMHFFDKEKNKRTEIRIKWWEDPTKMTYKAISVENIEHLHETAIHLGELTSLDFYPTHEKIVFFGHYWLNGQPEFYKHNICCLDYSVAKGGKLVAYRFNGESRLDKNNLVYV